MQLRTAVSGKLREQESNILARLDALLKQRLAITCEIEELRSALNENQRQQAKFRTETPLRGTNGVRGLSVGG